ncbi:hypothetical protein ABZZ17_16380 [Streptomyces sp. NPDC006512]
MLAPAQAAFGPTWIEDCLHVCTGDPAPARGLFWHPNLAEDI